MTGTIHKINLDERKVTLGNLELRLTPEERELDYKLVKEPWAFAGNRIAVRFAMTTG